MILRVKVLVTKRTIEISLAGYYAASTVATLFNQDLKGFDKFYSRPKPDVQPPKSKVERWRDDCKKGGLKSSSLKAEQIASTSTAQPLACKYTLNTVCLDPCKRVYPIDLAKPN